MWIRLSTCQLRLRLPDPVAQRFSVLYSMIKHRESRGHADDPARCGGLQTAAVSGAWAGAWGCRTCLPHRGWSGCRRTVALHAAKKTPHRGAGFSLTALAVGNSRRGGITRQLPGRPEQPEPSGHSRRGHSRKGRSHKPARTGCSRGPSRRRNRSRCRNHACWCCRGPRSSC